MRVLKFLLGAILLLTAILVIGGFLLPDRVHVERSIVIDRSPAHVYSILNSYKRFNEWSPWADQDPNATYTYSGPASGVGAGMAWVGDPKTVGSGSQKIIASAPDQRVETALDFGEQGKGTAAFVLTPEAKGTRVVWGFDTDFEGNLIGRWVGLFMEKLLAPDYEKGLARLKDLLESESVPLVPGPDAAAPATGSASLEDAPTAQHEARAELIRRRIEERRQQMRDEAERHNQKDGD